MDHNNISVCFVPLMMFAWVLVESARGDDPRTTTFQRLREQAVETIRSRVDSEGKKSDGPRGAMSRVFGWARTAGSASYPAEILLCDQVLSDLTRNVAAANVGAEVLSKAPVSLTVHVTYGADCGTSVQALLDMENPPGTRADIRCQLWLLNDRWIRQVDSDIPRTRADVFATVRAREKATQRDGEIFVFASLALTEAQRGRFQWERLAETRRFIPTR